MMLSELIDRLLLIVQEHGDMPVFIRAGYDGDERTEFDVDESWHLHQADPANWGYEEVPPHVLSDTYWLADGNEWKYVPVGQKYLEF